MSKGLGKVELAVLDSTYPFYNPANIVRVKARQQLGLDDKPSTRVILSRAMRSLIKKKLVEVQPSKGRGHIQFIRRVVRKPEKPQRERFAELVNESSRSLERLSVLRLISDLKELDLSEFATDLYSLADGFNDLAKLTERKTRNKPPKHTTRNAGQ